LNSSEFNLSAWRRGGDNTQRAVIRQKPLWTPRGALLN